MKKAKKSKIKYYLFNLIKILLVLGIRRTTRLISYVTILACICLCTFVESMANESAGEKIYIKLGDLRSGVHLRVPSLDLFVYSHLVSYEGNWYSRIINENIHLIQHKRWKDFYWKIDAANNTVYKIKGNISNYSGETGTAIDNIIFNPSDIIILIFPLSYLELNTRTGEVTLIWEGIELASKEYFELKQVSSNIFHLRSKVWGNFFWKIDGKQKKMYFVREGSFGTLQSGKETEIDTQIVRNLSEEPQAKEKHNEIVIPFGNESIIAKGYEIIYKTPMSFTVPTVSMLLKYRPHVREHFIYDEKKYSFFEIVENVSYEISTARIYEGKVWVGFSFYEGEGFEGYGGIGFYDTESNLLGVLRHPALVDCSVKDLLIDSEKIYIQTVGNYEGESTVCNGIVVIDQKSLSAKSMVPPGGKILWNKDEPATAPEFYNKPIEKIYKDRMLVIGDIKSWNDKEITEIREIGLEQYMINLAKGESSERERIVAGSLQVDKRTVTLQDKITEESEKHFAVFYKDSHGSSAKVDFARRSEVGFAPSNPTRLCSNDWFSYVYFTASGGLHDFKSPLIYPPIATIIHAKDTPWIYAEKGKRWKFETSKYVFEIELEDFESKPLKCFTKRGKLMDNKFFGMDVLFDSITFTTVIKKLDG